jgi:hypothetical protein
MVEVDKMSHSRDGKELPISLVMRELQTIADLSKDRQVSKPWNYEPHREEATVLSKSFDACPEARIEGLAK